MANDKRTKTEIKREIARQLARDLEPGGSVYKDLAQYYPGHESEIADEAIRTLRKAIERIAEPR